MFSYSAGSTSENPLISIAEELPPMATEVDDTVLRERLARFVRENPFAIIVRRPGADEWLALSQITANVDIRQLLEGTLRLSSWSQRHLGDLHEAEVYLPKGMGAELHAALLSDRPPEPTPQWLNHPIPVNLEQVSSSKRGPRMRADWDAYQEAFNEKCNKDGYPNSLNDDTWQRKADVQDWLAKLTKRDGYTNRKGECFDKNDTIIKKHAGEFMDKYLKSRGTNS